ncbi:MAG: DUF3168 domain-containing protein [Pseudomonadota bacterium]
MSYAASAALQAAVFQALDGSAALAALAPGGVHDAAPHAQGPEAAPGLRISLGEERVSNWSAQGLAGSMHDLEVIVHGPEQSFAAAKAAAGAVSDALLGPLPALAAGRVATADFRGARARRDRDGGRRVEIRFRFRVEA